jgi:hypothetical protein
MWRIALICLTLMLGGCAYKTWWNPPFWTIPNPHLPHDDSVNMERVMGHEVAVKPLTTEPGDIWPGPIAPPTKGSPLNRAGNPLLAPIPNGTPGAPAPGQPNQSQGDRRIIVPNGNGTSTVIYPDGRIETIPTPK